MMMYGVLQSRLKMKYSSVLEFLCVVVPMILACTLYSSSYMTLYGAIVGVSACFVYLKTPREQKSKINTTTTTTTTQYVSWFRATILLFTCICILAVDFKVFPRRFGKCEETGTGLMDIGVGSFVFSSALLSRASRGKKDSSMIQIPSRMKRLGQLLTLGFLRLAVHSGIQYQHHVSEYGTHWNFFFTLASLMILTSLLPVSKFPLTLGLILLLSYEYFLTAMNGSSYMFEAPRVDLLSSNREGILGALGFMGIYCITVSIGSRFVWTKRKRKELDTVRELLLLSGALCFVYICCDRFVSPASRRMVNLTYAIWILAQNVFMLCLFAAVQCLLGLMRGGVPKSNIIEGLSRNTLSVFLISNLATGLVNLSMNTIEASDQIGFLVVSTYMGFVFIAASFISTANRNAAASKKAGG